MSKLEFVLGLVDALAWPAACVFLFFIVRRELPGRLRSLSRLKVGSLEADFRESLREAAADGGSRTPITDDELAVRIPEAVLIAEISPKAAIPHAWAQLEQALIGALGRLQGFTYDAMGYRMSKQIEILKENGFLSPHDAESLHELRRLRNKISHHMAPGEEITFDTAKKYAQTCANYIEIFNNMKPEGTGGN